MKKFIKENLIHFLKVNDNYPKYVLSLDDFDMSYMGVKHLNIINFLTGNEI